MITLPNYPCDFRYPIVTMGTFDGVHKGHKKLLSIVKERAEIMSGEAVVLTYYHHPLETLNKVTHPYLLTEKEKKESILKQHGIDCVVYLNFTFEMAKMTPEEFLKEVLIGKLGAKEIVFGYDTHFGDKRRGGYEFLKSMEKKYNYVGDIVYPFQFEGKNVSSSWIRSLVKDGKIEQANHLLGYQYSVFGTVIEGLKIGRTLGFPTLNLKHHHPYKLLPKAGIYFTKIRINNKIKYGLTNIGYSPTIKKNAPLEIETHLLNFDGNLYDKDIELFFLERIRDEKKFETTEKLITEINQDVQKANQLIKKYSK